MPTYSIDGPDGKTYSIDGPAGASQADVVAKIKEMRSMGQGSGETSTDSSTSPQKPGDTGKLDYVLGTLGNVPGSAWEAGKAIAQPILHPIETAKNIGKLGAGTAGLISEQFGGPTTGYEEAPKTVGKFFADRYGGMENLKKTIHDDPVGFAMDLSTVLTGGETALARVPGVVGKVGEVAGSVGRAVDPLRAAAGTASVAGKGLGYLGSGGAETAARTDVARALERDKLGAEEAKRRGSAMPGTVLPDVAGENVRGLMERVAQTPGAGRTIVTPFLMERQQAQADRIAGDLSSLTGTKRTALQAVTQTMEQQKKAASPLYQKAYQDGDKEIWSPELERLSSSPTIRSAMQGAVRIWQDNAVADGFGAMNPSQVDRGGLITFGKSVPAFPNIQFWDYTKRILDDKISTAKRAGQNQKVRTLTQLANKLRQDLDTQVPSYAQARQSWAGPASYLDAIETGRGILNKTESAEEFTNNFRALGASDQHAAREGAVSSIIGKMGGDPAKLGDMTKYLRSPEVRRKIAAIMPSQEAADKWLKRLEFEIKSSELSGQALKGSATARRLAEMQDADGIVGDLVADAFAGTAPMSLIRRLTIGQATKIRDKLRARRDEETARILTNPNALSKLPDVLGKKVLPHSPMLNPQNNLDSDTIRKILQGSRVGGILGSSIPGQQ